MIITRIESIPLRIPFKPDNHSDAAAWGDKNLPAAASLLVKVTTDHWWVGARPSGVGSISQHESMASRSSPSAAGSRCPRDLAWESILIPTWSALTEGE
jgi:hypothetical protein